MRDLSTRLTEELVEYFRSEHFTIVGAKNVEGFRPPTSLQNDGYGDQLKKQPDVFAFDEIDQRFVIGVIKTNSDELESPDSLTQYDVFFDHRNANNGKSSRVCFLLPPNLIPEFTAIITHYIHRDYWKNMMLVRSRCFDQDR
jgi:hypothetical protein